MLSLHIEHVSFELIRTYSSACFLDASTCICDNVWTRMDIIHSLSNYPIISNHVVGYPIIIIKRLFSIAYPNTPPFNSDAKLFQQARTAFTAASRLATNGHYRYTLFI